MKKTFRNFVVTDKKSTLRSILESSGGIHLTAYLVNRGNIVDLKTQLRKVLVEARACLRAVQTNEEGKKFFEPLAALLGDARIFRGMKGNIGIFRSDDSFRILNIPVEVERQCHVADSFHVKPLLRWMQSDREFLLLGLKPDSAHLYLGSRTSIQKIDSILFPDFPRSGEGLEDYSSLKRARHLRATQEETFAWMSDWLQQITQRSAPKLFIAGEKSAAERLLKHLKYANVVAAPVASNLGEHNLPDVCSSIRRLMANEATRTLDQALMEFRFAEEMNLAKKNIFVIAKAAVQGRVKKLIVAEDLNVFGKIDKKTGGLAIHPFDLDHEDDDILDDLAQAVLASGGEVVIAPKDEIPKGRPVLAILKHGGTGLEKTGNVEKFELLMERASV